MDMEDRMDHIDASDVLRPASIPDDASVKSYIASLGARPELRPSGKVSGAGIFSGEAGRSLLEQEFLKAGVMIRKMCPNLIGYQRPLGNRILASFGFGALTVTYRNCPNNCPLAFWVGDPWYPLFARRTNTESLLQGNSPALS